MSDWTTLRIRKTTKAQAEKDKRDEESWDAYIERCSREKDTDTTETETQREFVDLEDMQIDEGRLYRRIDDLETEIKHTIEREIRR